MLRKLHIRIVLINMSLVGLVLLLVFGALCYTSYRNMLGDMDDDLVFAAKQAAVRYENKPFSDEFDAFRDVIGTPPDKKEDGQAPSGQDPGKGSMDRTPSIVVLLDQYGDVETIFNDRQFSVSEETLDDTVDLALAQEKDSVGHYSAEDLFYKKVEIDGRTYIALASSVRAYEEFHRLAVLSVLGWLAFMAVFLVISIIMTRFTLKPVKRSWEQQQQFVADASHELKTPLTVILANNSILAEDETLSEESRVWVDSTQEEARHMQTLISHLLYLARSDAGSQKIVLQDLSLTDMVYEDVLQFEPVAFERGVTVGTDLDENVRLEGDATMVKQLIHILLDNACKYSPDGSAVDVSLKRTGKGAQLSVHNMGTPIPAEDLPHIFERFYRSDKSRTLTDGSGGYGLGLSIAQAIAKDHKASITCQSTEKDGTTFTVTFREILK